MKIKLIYLLLICVIPVIGNAQENYRLELVKTEPVTINKKRSTANKLKEIRTIGGKVVGHETPMYVGLVDTGKIILNNGVEILTDIQGVTYISDDEKTIVRWGNKTSTIKNKMKRNSFNDTDSMFIAFYDENGKLIRIIDEYVASNWIKMSNNGNIFIMSELQSDTAKTYLASYGTQGKLIWQKRISYNVNHGFIVSKDGKNIALFCSNNPNRSKALGNLLIYNETGKELILKKNLQVSNIYLKFHDNSLGFSSGDYCMFYDIKASNIIYQDTIQNSSPIGYFKEYDIVILKRRSIEKIREGLSVDTLVLWSLKENVEVFSTQIPVENRYNIIDVTIENNSLIVTGNKKIYNYKLKK